MMKTILLGYGSEILGIRNFFYHKKVKSLKLFKKWVWKYGKTGT